MASKMAAPIGSFCKQFYRTGNIVILKSRPLRRRNIGLTLGGCAIGGGILYHYYQGRVAEGQQYFNGFQWNLLKISAKEVDDGTDSSRSMKNPQHQFQSFTFLFPTWCDHCGKFVFGFMNQAKQCQSCGMNSHHHCVDSVRDKCVEDQQETLGIRHKFSSVFFKRPTWCDSCGYFIFGLYLQGQQCSECKLNIHHNCFERAPKNCGISQRDIMKLKLDIPHEFEQHYYKKPTWCDHCGSLLWGFYNQGENCQQCGMNTHHSCADEVPHLCRVTPEKIEGLMKMPPHEFKFYTYMRPTWCDQCGKFLFGFSHQGMKCKDCGVNVHGHCLKNTASSCATKPDNVVVGSEVEPTTTSDDPQHLTSRRRRFELFASREYNGHMYMTPLDFLDSVTQETPTYTDDARKLLTEKEVQKFVSKVPRKSNGSSHLFRNMNYGGLISYTEFLFLLTILTKPKAGFKLAFDMFDRDGNEKIDRNEFLVFEEVFGTSAGSQGPQVTNTLVRNEYYKHYINQSGKADGSKPKTLLLVHFFGPNGKDTLKYQEFYSFMDNLQSEVLEIEFSEFSHGRGVISEESFAKILFRYTLIDKNEYQEYLDRLKQRMPHGKGITFKEFKEFCQFLSNLDDFAVAVKMFSYADQPIAQADFKRAVKLCTGHELDPHVINTVFQIFDIDNDGKLSHNEFIGVMKDRLHRGFRYHSYKYQNWHGYKVCVRHEMKNRGQLYR